MLLDSFCNFKAIGHVGPTPETTFRDDGGVMASFRVGTSLPLRSASRVDARIVWQNVIAFGKIAEYVRDNVPEGARIYFEGAVYPSYVKDSNGTLIPQMHLAASKVILLSTREEISESTRQHDLLQRIAAKRVRPAAAQDERLLDCPF